MDRPLPARADVVVVGCGFSGTAAALRLLRDGHDVVVLERADDVGGVWRDNTYPGCACDVPSHLYSLSFALWGEWTRSFASQPEIRRYLRRVVERSGLLPRVHLSTEVLSADWDDDAAEWVVTTSRGAVRATALVAAAGALSEPVLPDIPGLASFAGRAFHSARWDHGHDLRGRRVAVVGTGASAIQLVPHVQRQAERVVLLQRTAPWVLPRRDRAFRPVERAVYRRLPLARRAARFGIWLVRESWMVGFRHPSVMRRPERMALEHLREQVPDPVKRERLTPRYRLGCKRVLLSNDYYPAVAQDNVDVVTDRLAEVLPHAVVTESADGTRTEHEVDTIVLGTGFAVTDWPIGHRVRGRDGRTLMEHWGRRLSSLHGTTTAGFPNFFMMLGPNTGTGNTSVVLMAEAQADYVASALGQLRARGALALEPRPEAELAWDARVQRGLRGTVWSTGGCSSWYVDRFGRNTTLWPGTSLGFRRALRTCDLAQYEVRYGSVRRERVPA